MTVTVEVNVLYGRGNRSGGPEATHQLVHELRALGVPAFLVPVGRTRAAQRVADYDVYDAPERRHVPHAPGQVVVAPEVYLPELLAMRDVRRVCWWLSIDNSPVFRAERYAADVVAGLADRPRLREARAFVWLAHRELARWRPRLRDIDHVAQSHYAAEYLRRRLGVTAPLLTDYIPGAASGAASVERPDRDRLGVAYNPAKGHRLLRRVQLLTPDLHWLPISGLTPDGVRDRLGEATVYLDLGQHPGKDRMPREAALAGAVTVVARRGSGADDTDVALPADHKLELGRDLPQRAAALVRTILGDPATAFRRQDDYRAGIRGEHEVFRTEVAAFAAGLRATAPARGGS